MFTVQHQISLSNLVPVAVGAAVGIVALELWKWGRREQSKKVSARTTLALYLYQLEHR